VVVANIWYWFWLLCTGLKLLVLEVWGVLVCSKTRPKNETEKLKFISLLAVSLTCLFTSIIETVR
jgi:hypothetical protein